MKQKNYIILLLAAFIVFSSCKKELNLQPTDTFSEVNAYLTINDIQLGVYGAYTRYGTVSNLAAVPVTFANGSFGNDIYVSSLLSDEAKLGVNNAGQGALTYRYQFGSDATSGGDVIAAFGNYYRLINQVNKILPKIPTVTASAAEEPKRNIFKGELLGLRAIAHFALLQAYCKRYSASDPLGVPIMLVSDPLTKPARNSMGDVMNRIETDLADAKLLLPAVTPVTFTDTTLNRINIAAYQARIALYKGDYDAAITFATEVITSNVKQLVTGAGFAGIWTDQNTNESLFRIKLTTITTLGSLWTTTGGAIYIAPSDKLVAAYAANDIRKAIYIGTAGANNYVNKFYTSSRGGRIVDMKAARIAEMYLIRAEANAKKATPNITAGAADLNALRAQRINPYTDEVFATATDLFNAVMLERYKELAFEGFRFFDLKRNSLPVQRLATDANAEWQTMDVSSFRFVLPIPASEILVNPNMIQNAGY